MYIEEDELIELRMLESIHQDDVALLIESNDSLEGLIEDLKEYFKLDDEYYKEREEVKRLIKKAMKQSA